MQRFIITIGILLLVVGFAYPWFQKFGIGSLPGDLEFRGERYAVHFPIVTCLILTLVVNLIFWLVRKLI